MGFNRFYLHIVIRVILIVSNGLVLSFFISQDDKIMSTIIAGILIVIQSLLLIKYINKTNANLASFLLRIQSKDTAVNYQDDQIMKSFKGLNLSFDQINNELKQIRIENEQKSHYLNTIVDHAKTGIIAFDQKGKIALFNPEARKILKCEMFTLLGSLKEKLPEFHDSITSSFDQKSKIVKLKMRSEILNLALNKTQIDIGSSTVFIISFQNISRELDHNELESWQKLIQVLNHEIMNSLTPITSLSKVIRRYIQVEGTTKKASELSDEIICDIATNTEIIEERGKGLIDFIEVYKDISKNPELHLIKFKVLNTVQKIEKFYQDKFKSKGIKLSVEINAELDLFADEAMVEQILINLFKNSMEALKDAEKPRIHILANHDEGFGTSIQIADNGIGIPETELGKIFIPFYSTKENGSGIGLSLARQIMYLHKGSISVQSRPREKTIFTLSF